MSTEQLRECLADCQLNHGLPPELCQDECGALTPIDVGCGSYWSCVWQGLPGSVADVDTALRNAPAAIGEAAGTIIGDIVQPLQTPLLGLGVILVAGLVAYAVLTR